LRAIRLRKEKIKTPIIVLGFTLPTFYKEAIQHDIILTLSGFESLDAMMKIKETKGKNNMLRVHVKVDTGMHRQGFQWGEHELLLKRLNSPEAKSRLRVEGLYTHFADAKSPRDREYTFKQIKEFENWKNQFALHGLTVISHASATSGTLIYPEDRYDMVRIGIGLYGSWPADEIQKYLEDTFTLKPVLSWKTVVAEVKQVKRGERIGYNLTELLTRDSKIAVLPIGYWHGFRRSMSSKGRVLIHSKTARVLGRVSMDMIVVDVTDIFSVKMGDVAVIIGKSGKEEITAGELARFMGTTDYEVLTTINPLIKKFYI
jgi:alanine racemase